MRDEQPQAKARGAEAGEARVAPQVASNLSISVARNGSPRGHGSWRQEQQQTNARFGSGDWRASCRGLLAWAARCSSTFRRQAAGLLHM